MRSLGQLLRYHRHLEVDCAGWLHRVLLEEVRDHAYEHIDSLRTIDVRTIVGRALLQSDRRRWEDGDKLDPILYAAVSKRAVMKIACPRISRPPIFRICPFRIIAIASKPANVLRAVRNPPKPSPGRTRRLMRR